MSKHAGNPHAVLEAIRRLAIEKLDWQGEEASLALDSRLVEDLHLDSIRLLTLAMEIEDHFEICLEERDEAALTTVGDLVTLVLAKREANAG